MTFKCVHCGHLLDHFVAKHVCPSCGVPQPVSESEDYFSLLGVPCQFKQDRAILEKNFYQVSRALHPDRFTASDSNAKSLSLTRMSLLNQAYGTLKSPERLREYILNKHGVQAPKATIPAVLAEAWFEIQDLLMEDPVAAQGKLSEFEVELSTLRKKSEKNLIDLENQYDNNSKRETLEKLAQEVQAESYLISMQRDVERIKKNANPN